MLPLSIWERRELLERECHIWYFLQGLWRESQFLQRWDRQKCFHERRWTPWQVDSSRWGKFCTVAPFFAPSPGEGGGGGVRDEGDWLLQHPLGSANHGECPDINFSGGVSDEQEEWNGRSTSWENAAQEVGWQLDWRQLILFTWQVTRETLSSRAGQPNIFQFFYWLHFDQHLFVCLFERNFVSGNY